MSEREPAGVGGVEGRARVVRAVVLVVATVSIAASPQVAALGTSREPSTTGSPAPGASSSVRSAPPSAPVPSAFGQGQLAWTRLDQDGARPTAREDHTMTVDVESGVAWVYGGRTAGGRVLGDLWRLDLATDRWQRLQRGDRAPRGRFGHGAAWVPDVGLVIWAGQAARGFLDDLWAYDPGTAQWRPLADPDQRRPRARYGSCMSLGPDGRLWISHGFTDDLGRFDDTWAFDLATGRWHEETPAGRRPGARCLHDCTWGPDGRFVLYGGQTTGVPALGDVWTMTIGDGWRRVPGAEPPMSEPAARSLPALAAVDRAAWVVGGADIDRAVLSDTWSLDLASMAWESTEVGDRAPRARSGAALVADPARGRLLLFGGRDPRAAFGDLWALGTPLALSQPSA